jgi:predicted transcriptional regulator
MDKTTIYLPRDMHVAIEEIARRKQRPQAHVIREAIAAYIDQQEPPWPKSIGMISHSDVRSDEIEEWLERNWKPD